MHQLYLCLSNHGKKKSLCDCQITLKFQAEIVVPYTRKPEEGQLLEKTAGTDIIAHGGYCSEENNFFFLFSFIPLGWTTILI